MPNKVVIEHASLPKYWLSIEIAPRGSGTVVTWDQTFDKPEVGKAIEHIVVPANKQNL